MTVEKYKQRDHCGGRSDRHFVFCAAGERASFFSEGFQAVPVRPSDKDRVKMKTLGR
jgi:hypothetical protein